MGEDGRGGGLLVYACGRVSLGEVGRMKMLIDSESEEVILEL